MAAINRTYISTYFLLFPTLRIARFPLVVLLCVVYQPAVAQVCTDPAGPIIINQDFGNSGYNGSVAGLTSYQYEPIDCPNDGQYTVLPRLDGNCFNATWYELPEDHTPGDVKGNMMVVNGGSKPGVFYQQPVTGLCKGTTYEVSVWAVNVLRINTCTNALVPNLSVNVETKEGILIQSAALGPIDQTPAPVWKRLSTTFTTSANAENVVIKLINNQGNFGCGNDMAIDDVQVRQCSECVGVPELVYVPGAFTPNKDGLNETLAVFLKTSTADSFQIQIYDRWGSLVFASTDPANRWDGTCGGAPCQAGEYAWVVSHRSGLQKNVNHTQTGRVVLIRHE